MKWSSLWKVLKVIAENAPTIIMAVEAMKKDGKGNETKTG